MFRNSKKPEISIPIELEEVLTGNACTHIVMELVKYIMLQKQQIPLSYDSLDKYCKRSEAKNRNMAVITKFMKSLEDVSDNLATQMALDACEVKEVVILIGATIFSPKVCIRIEVPSIILHRDTHQDHVHDKRKPLLSIMRLLLMCPEFQNDMALTTGLTNTFILIQKKDLRSTSEFFLPKPQFKISPLRAAVFNIKLNYSSNIVLNCDCGKLVRPYNDSSYIPHRSRQSHTEKSQCMSDIPLEWYQSKEVLKGFKLLC